MAVRLRRPELEAVRDGRLRAGPLADRAGAARSGGAPIGGGAGAGASRREDVARERTCAF